LPLFLAADGNSTAPTCPTPVGKKPQPESTCGNATTRNKSHKKTVSNASGLETTLVTVDDLAAVPSEPSLQLLLVNVFTDKGYTAVTPQKVRTALMTAMKPNGVGQIAVTSDVDVFWLAPSCRTSVGEASETQPARP
jgi:hypothetical protein